MNGEMAHRDNEEHAQPPMHIGPVGPCDIRLMLRYQHPSAHFPSLVESQEIP